MRILFIVIGILSLFFSCTGRKKKGMKEDDSALNGFEMEKSEFRFDTDTFWSTIPNFSQDRSKMEACTNRFDVAAFEQHKKNSENDCYVNYTETLPNDTFMECIKDKTSDHIEYVTIKHPKDSYLSYESIYYENGTIKSEKTYGPGNGMLLGISRYYFMDGRLQQEVNEDDGYSFTFEQLMSLLNERGMYIPKVVDLDYRYEINKVIAEDGLKTYFVIYPLSHDTNLTITVSGQDGSIIDEHRYPHQYY